MAESSDSKKLSEMIADGANRVKDLREEIDRLTLSRNTLKDEESCCINAINSNYDKIVNKVNENRLRLVKTCTQIYNQVCLRIEHRISQIESQVDTFENLNSQTKEYKSGSFLELVKEFENLKLQYEIILALPAEKKKSLPLQNPICEFQVNTKMLERAMKFTGYLYQRHYIRAKDTIKGSEFPTENFTPAQIAIAEDNFLYILDRPRNKSNLIHIIDSKLVFISSIIVEKAFAHTGQFTVTSLAVSRKNLYIAVPYENTICVFKRNGDFVSHVNVDGSTYAKKLSHPNAVTTSAVGHTIIADSGNNRVIVFTSDLTCSHEIGGRPGTPSHLCFPEKLGVTFENTIVVLHRGHPSIHIYTFHGALLQQCDSLITGMQNFETNSFSLPPSNAFQVPPDTLFMIGRYNDSNCVVYDLQRGVVHSISTIAKKSLLLDPDGSAFSHDGKFYVCDTRNHRIQIYDLKDFSLLFS